MNLYHYLIASNLMSAAALALSVLLHVKATRTRDRVRRLGREP